LPFGQREYQALAPRSPEIPKRAAPIAGNLPAAARGAWGQLRPGLQFDPLPPHPARRANVRLGRQRTFGCFLSWLASLRRRVERRSPLIWAQYRVEPFSLARFAQVDFPEPIPPVNPIITGRLAMRTCLSPSRDVRHERRISFDWVKHFERRRWSDNRYFASKSKQIVMTSLYS
jgi:hypothetical protein